MIKTYSVYIHTTPNKKYYVGITSLLPKHRWCKTGKGYKRHPYFYNAIKKYGWNNIDHEIIASNLTHDEACSFEKLLITKLNSNDRLYGYNISEGGEGTCGVDRCGEKNGRSTKVKCITTGEIFSNIKMAMDKYNLKSRHCSDVCMGRRKYWGTCDGKPLVWEYYKEVL